MIRRFRDDDGDGSRDFSTYPGQPRRRRWRWRRGLGIFVIALVAAGAGYAWWSHREPVAPIEIYRGVFYSCQRLPETPESGGLMHLVEIDLTAPGIEIYATPTNTDALINGSEYRTDWPGSVGGKKGLAVAINGATFGEEPGMFPWPGDLANSEETIVADGQVNHVDPNTYLLWFEDDLTPHLEHEKPPSDAVLKRARWGIGGQQVVVLDGVVRTGADQPDERTIIAIDPQRKRLWLAVFERASYVVAAQMMVEHGAQLATMLDGGSSTTMYLGSDAKGVRGGTLMQGWRPVATTFGIKAQPLK